MNLSQALLLSLGVMSTLIGISAHATILPYSTRTRDFSSWTPSTRGDINTIGMAGATVATPISISAAEGNPAGYGMLTGSISAQINKISLGDTRLQRSGEPIDSSQWGLGVSPSHQGYSLSYYSPQTESGTYASPNTGDTVKTEVSLKELRLTTARAFFDDHLALGISLELLKAVRELNSASSNAYGLSYQVGALYRLPYHILLGGSFSPQARVSPASNPDSQNIMPGFNRAVVRPLLATGGAGWIPNRFFKIGASLTYAGATDNTALLADQTVITGATATWVPRLGASYVVAEYTNFKVEGALGSYYDSSRLSDSSNRVHVTAGLEANPYFINLGTGIDIADGYKNIMLSVGIDIVRTARAFDIIPKDPVPAINKRWPDAFTILPDGLPEGLTRGEERKFGSTNVQQVEKIIEDVPGNISKRVSGEKTSVVEKEDQEKLDLKKQGLKNKKRRKKK